MKFFFYRVLAVWFSLICFTGLKTLPTLAQQAPLGFAEYVRIQEENIQDGNIVTLEGGKYSIAKNPYHIHMYGVISEQPPVAVSAIGRNQAYPVLPSGTADVLVSAKNGAIAEGDYVTSSDIPGVGMKATQSGYVLGTAQGTFDGSSGEQGKIPVVVDIEFISSPQERANLSFQSFATQLQDVVTVGTRAVATEPNNALRYAAAAFVLIASIAFAFLIFGRAAANGISAVGRNPLAKRAIFVMVFFNIAMTAVFALVGLGLAIFILAV